MSDVFNLNYPTTPSIGATSRFTGDSPFSAFPSPSNAGNFMYDAYGGSPYDTSNFMPTGDMLPMPATTQQSGGGWSDAFSMKSFLGSDKQMGWGTGLFGMANAGFKTYLGMQALDQAKERFNWQKDAWQKSFNEQKRQVERSYSDRKRTAATSRR